MRDLVKGTGVSRSTLYTWLDGSPASATTLRQFALGLAALKAEAAGEPASAPQLFQTIHRDLQIAMGQSAPAMEEGPEFGFVPYAPICDLPPGTSDPDTQTVADWTFLGSLLGLLQKARGGVQGGYRVGVGAFAGLEADVLAGFFANPGRAVAWRFLRTPIQVPLNGLVLRRDLSTFVRRVLPTLRKGRSSDVVTTDGYLEDLQQALWRPGAHGSGADPVVGDLLPLSVHNEAGREYVQRILGFGDAEIARREGDADFDVEPGGLQQWLLASSDRFQRTVEDGELSSADLRLPVLLVDELTCLRVLAASPNGWRNTEPVLLSSLREDVLSEAPRRPRFSVSIAVKKASPNAAEDFETTGAALEELLWSNTSIVAGYYANLFHALQQVVGAAQKRSNAIGTAPIAGLYVLRWLSLDLSASEREALVDDGPPLGGVPGRGWFSPAVTDCAAWADILAGAKGLLLRDPALREQLRGELRELGGRGEPGTDARGS